MNSESVIDFLGCVPLLKRLSSSSIQKIAQVVNVQHYDQGAYVVREGEVADGIYFIWDGEAEVCGSFRSDDENRPEFQLKKYDYFGQGVASSTHQADIIALSKLTCLILPNGSTDLLRPKSVWTADKTNENWLRFEEILNVDPVDVNIFRGATMKNHYGSVYGGLFIGQALAAASKTVDCSKIVHSLHAYFLVAGDLEIPIIYQVHRIRDGKTFETRRVDAMQKGKIVFMLIASFQKEEEGFEHQVATMPSVPNPEELLSEVELLENELLDPRLPRTFRNKVATAILSWPIEITFCQPETAMSQTQSPPSMSYWFKARETLSDDQALHRCVLAFACDRIFGEVSMYPHRAKGFKSLAVSLDHAMWFHRSFRADEWLLFVIYSPSAHNRRGFVSGQIFTRKGELVCSLTQEDLLMSVKQRGTPIRLKL